MSKHFATTNILRRITKYLIIHQDENDIEWEELKKSAINVSSGVFADAMKYLLETGQVKCVMSKSNKKYYFYNNYLSKEYIRVNKALVNERKAEIEMKFGNNPYEVIKNGETE